MKKIFQKLFKAISNNKPKNDSSWEKKIINFQNIINYKFKNLLILKNAMSHVSYTRNQKNSLSSFERMEFFGDSIMGFVVAEKLFEKYPQKREGLLSKYKSKIVSEKYLVKVAKNINLGEYLLISKEEAKSGGRERVSIISDALEALICAIYLDGGLEKAKNFILKFILKNFENSIKSEDLINYKSLLQEHYQAKYQNHPHYILEKEEGPSHKKVFTIQVFIKDNLIGNGFGLSKKEAEQNAAKNAWKSIKNN